MGFSHTWFILNDQQYYGVKKVNIQQKGDSLLITDDGILAHNYPVKPAKHVRQTGRLFLTDSAGYSILSGPFSTNPTREYASLTGYIRLYKVKDYTTSSLIPHLEELALSKELVFLQKAEKERDILWTNTQQVSAKKPSPSKPGKETARAQQAEPSVQLKLPTEFVNEREDVIQQSTYFTGDSLFLSLYDNGEVDGDTVSVLMNGKLLISNVGLSTKAVNHSIDVHGLDTVKLVMYAETLGSIPPNTGLLVVHSGRETHEIRFSGNFSRNAAIVLHRKTPGL